MSCENCIIKSVVKYFRVGGEELDIAKLTEGYLVQITKACNETSYIAVPSGNHIIFVVKSVFNEKDGEAVVAISVGIPVSRFSAGKEEKISRLVIGVGKKDYRAYP